MLYVKLLSVWLFFLGWTVALKVPATDPVLAEALRRYHKQPELTNIDKSDLLCKEFGIDMKYGKALWIYTLILWLHGRPQTVKKCWQELGLLSSQSTKRTMPEEEQRSHIASAIANDPQQWHGPRTIQHKLAFQGIQLPRYVSLLKNCNNIPLKTFSEVIHETMLEMDPEGFQKWHPSAQRLSERPLCRLGLMTNGVEMAMTSSTKLVLVYSIWHPWQVFWILAWAMGTSKQSAWQCCCLFIPLSCGGYERSSLNFRSQKVCYDINFSPSRCSEPIHYRLWKRDNRPICFC